MTPAELQERLSTVGAEMDRVAAILVAPAPANLDRCACSLESALLDLTEISLHLSSADADPDSFAAAGRVQAGLRRAAALLDRAGHFHQGWNRILAAMCAGYQAGGDAAPMVRPPRLCLEG
jgi:hypothetical protein